MSCCFSEPTKLLDQAEEPRGLLGFYAVAMEPLPEMEVEEKSLTFESPVL